MDQARSSSGNAEDNVGIPDDLRCKRSDGKQWRCTAMSMPDKTVCEKHYIQAKKRAANSAMRASLKKAKKRSLGETDVYLESRSDDFDVPLAPDYSRPNSGKKLLERVSKNQFRYTPDRSAVRNTSTHASPKTSDDSPEKNSTFEEHWRSYESPPASGIEYSRKKPQRSFEANTTEYSDASTDPSEDTGGQICHQCQSNNRDGVIWCLGCDKRGYCGSCISAWYSDISMEEIQRHCPGCRGICSCKVCLRGDNSIKVRIREIPVLDKLQYLHSLLSSVLPVVKRIHLVQCSEVELEKKLRGTEIDLPRTKLNADEQMCCNLCRVPIIDYHRRCPNCSYDLCLNCCRDLREGNLDKKNPGTELYSDQEIVSKKPKFGHKFPDWRSNSDGSIPCPSKYGGCGFSMLHLSRIFKMNWVAKLAKNVEELVSGCTINNASNQSGGMCDGIRLCQFSSRKDSDDNFLYCPASEDLKRDGIERFRKHWQRGEPVIVKQVFDCSSMSSWDPVVIWRAICGTEDEKVKDENRLVQVIDCLDWSEVKIEMRQFIEGYSEGRVHDDGWPEMLKLKDWPSPSASEEFLLYQRPEFISKLPLLEYIHSKWGLLNVAAKLPHYSLQNDVGPKIYISYGIQEQLGRGDSVTNLHFNMRDMMYLLVHACELKLKGWQRSKIEQLQKNYSEAEVKEPSDPQICSERSLPDLSLEVDSNGVNESSDENESTIHGVEVPSRDQASVDGGYIQSQDGEYVQTQDGDSSQNTQPGVIWDIFRRQDVSKLMEYLRMHWDEFGKPDSFVDKYVLRTLYEGVVYLDSHHKRKLKNEFGVQPWSFEQHLGQAIFVPAGCPFQARNVQSTVQLGLDFLFPESLGEASRLAEGVCSLPDTLEAKLQVLEVGKISLYAASSSIKEAQKLVLDPKFSSDIGFEDPNLTAMVADNLKRVVKRRQRLVHAV